MHWQATIHKMIFFVFFGGGGGVNTTVSSYSYKCSVNWLIPIPVYEDVARHYGLLKEVDNYWQDQQSNLSYGKDQKLLCYCY